MMISIDAKTNSGFPWLNVMHLTTADGRKLILDRDETVSRHWDGKSGVVSVTWRGVYQWDGDKQIYLNSQKDIFKGAIVNRIEIEDDAPENYYFEPIECDAWGFYNDPLDEIISLAIEAPKSEKSKLAQTKLHMLIRKIKKLLGWYD